MGKKVHRLEVIGGESDINTTVRLDGKDIYVSGVIIKVNVGEYNSATLEFPIIETVVNVDVKKGQLKIAQEVKNNV